METYSRAKEAKQRIRTIAGQGMELQVKQLSADSAKKLANVLSIPSIKVRQNTATVPYGLNLFTAWGEISLDGTLANIQSVKISGQAFEVKDPSLDGLEKLMGNDEEIASVLGEPLGRQRRGRSRRGRRLVSFEDAQNETAIELGGSGISYDSLFDDLSGLKLPEETVSNIADDLFAQSLPENEIGRYLAFDSPYKEEIISAVTGSAVDKPKIKYDFKDVTAQDSNFAGRVLTAIGEQEGKYDEAKGVLEVNGRKITNLPSVDENGIFTSNGHKYIPNYVGYFAEEGSNRIERLRVMDPVQNAVSAVALQYKMTKGDVRFKTVLDVTRNLPDFDKHPYGKEILETMKKKVVLSKGYEQTNSLLADVRGRSDELGAVATIMLDPAARGLIDPLGTSNGANMGKTFYLTEKSQVNPDGTLTPGGDMYSPVGKILADYHVDRDNFNRNQMSFNSFLTSEDVKTLNVAYAEFAMWNSEDAAVMTKKGAETAFSMTKHVGDKIEDFHGNKGVLALIADPDMDEETAKKENLEQAVKFAKLNPDLDLIVSPVSLASRLNMGVAHEGLSGKRQDLHLPNGETVKDGICQIMYMSLPQTAEHKSMDYSKEGEGRRYSTLIHYALASKVGKDLYDKALIDPEVRGQHIDEAESAFNRMGVSFKNKEDLVKPGNINMFVDSPAEISVDDLSMMTNSAIRKLLEQNMEKGSININLGDKMSVTSPLTGEAIVDSFGEHVLPIKASKDGKIPYRYNAVFSDLSAGNKENLQRTYNRAIAEDWRNIKRKDNILKDIDTMRFKQEAHTDVLTPDPRLPLGDVRSTVKDKEVIIHRDPVIQSGNAISMNNVGQDHKGVVSVNPLIEVMMDADNDGDTLGIVGYSNLRLNDEEKQEFFDKSSVEEQVNQYGNVFLETDNSHFLAAAKANGLDTSNVTFKDGKSNKDLINVVEDLDRKIVDSPSSYGAYALSYENDQSIKQSLGRLADDGIKGNKEEMDRIFENGYTAGENQAILKALIAKSEWTGLAGSTTNQIISGLSSGEFDKDLTRVSLDVTHSMTQSVLQMKKNADKLYQIDDGIKNMKKVMSGEYGIEESRHILHAVTNGLVAPEAVDKFVDLTAAKQKDQRPSATFGKGVINHTEANTTTLAFETQRVDLASAIKDLGRQQKKENLQM